MSRAGNMILDHGAMTLLVKAGTVMTENTIAVVNANGYAEPGKKAEGLVAAGRVEKLCDNTAGKDGDKRVVVQRGTFVWKNDGTIKGTDVLKMCYIKDESTVTLTATGASKAGLIIAVDGNNVAVDMRAR